MKKIVIGFMAIICVMAFAFGFIIQSMTAQHEAELESVKLTNESLVMELREEYEENYKLETQVENLEDGFYSMMNDECFDVTIEHDNARYNYVCEDDGWFKNIRTIETRSVDN